GSQKNFARYAARIGSEWEKTSDAFNEFYFKRAVARGLIFHATERIVSAQPWYNGGYRANIVAYTLAVLGDITKRRKESIDFLGVWSAQKVDSVLEDTIALVSGVVNDDIIRPPNGISNISEWCKKDACWTRIQARIGEIEKLLPAEFYDRFLALDDQAVEVRSARQVQKIDNGIEAQRQVLTVPAGEWARIHQVLLEKDLLTPKEAGVLKIAMQIPAKLPTEKQCVVLLGVLDRGRAEGICV
ncbi:MAG: AIPR family protein, partial [Rhizobiaceae bacterium]